MPLVVFLRGVNVGGHRVFRPALLANELKDFDVVNIGAAGTFVVRMRVGKSRLRFELKRRLPFVAEIMICTAAELIAAATDPPFSAAPPDLVRFVSILAKRPRALPDIPASIPADGRWLLQVLAVRDRFVFGVYRREMKAIGCLGQLDRLFGMPATTRNWNTIGAIIEALSRSPSAERRR